MPLTKLKPLNLDITESYTVGNITATANIAAGNIAATTIVTSNGIALGYLGAPISGSEKTSSYTLALTDLGKLVSIGTGGSITIPDTTFSAGDVISIFNNTSGNATITCSISTAYISGTDTDVSSVILSTRGIAAIIFISGTVCVITGNVT